MERYAGKVTTVGNSEAIRLDKVLFKSHPEFRQGQNVTVAVIAPGQLLVSAVSSIDGAEVEDPVVGAFLSFLEDDMRRHPEALQPLSTSAIARAVELTAGIVVGDDEVFPPDVTI